MLRKILYIFSAFILLVLLAIPSLYIFYAPFTNYLNQYIYFSACDTPIQYRIGSIDPRFNISEDKLLSNISQAEQIWENANSKNMFEYDPKGELSFNMIYDNRQSLNTKIGELEGELDEGKSSLNAEIQEYERLASQFDEKLKNLNEEIDYWNNQGGAPSEEYERLSQEQKNLQEEADRLNAMAAELNVSTRQYNAQVGQLNATIDSFKEELNLRPEEGLYDGENQEITIFLTVSEDELIHTLAHEMGHALGIEHVSGETSIMFPFSTESIKISGEDLNALLKACKEQNKFQVAFQNLTIRLSAIIQQYFN